MDLSKSLRLAIAEKGVKHKDLAKQLGTTSQQISNWLKSGAIKQSSLLPVSNALDLSVSEFVALGE
jgi:transcriptional regulator with XRE-family HTH domain